MIANETTETIEATETVHENPPYIIEKLIEEFLPWGEGMVYKETLRSKLHERCKDTLYSGMLQGMWEAARTCKHFYAFPTYAENSVRWAMINAMRRERNHTHSGDKEIMAKRRPLIGFPDDFEYMAEPGTRTREETLDTLHSLPVCKSDMTLLELIYVDGLRQQDVANMWGYSRSLIGQRVQRIIKSLRNHPETESILCD